MPVAAALIDSGAVVLGAWLAYAIRFSAPFTSCIPIVTGLPPAAWYVRLSLVFAGLTVLFLLAGGMYRFPRQDELFDELTATLKRYLLAFMLLLAALFFYRQVSFSRVTMTLLLLFSGVCLILVRTVGRALRQRLYRMGIAIRRAAVVGESGQAARIVTHLSDHPEFGLTVVGGISDSEAAPEGLKHLGHIAEAGQAVQDHRLDTLIVSPTSGDRDALPGLVRACYGVNVDFLYLPDIQPADGRPRRVVEVGRVPLWSLKEAPFEGWPGVVKRCFDIAVSSLLMLAALPVITVIALAVKLDSRGPLLYRQRRVGSGGIEFDCLKFRSMQVDAEADTGPVWAKQSDPRVTRVGGFIRRWSLDELPQLWNVLRGDMSLVGPRPERPEFVRQFERRIDGYQERHRVRAGITGWAQVNGLRGDTPIEARTSFDRYYVENWSLLFDLKILALTIKAVLKGENSY